MTVMRNYLLSIGYNLLDLELSLIAYYSYIIYECINKERNTSDSELKIYVGNIVCLGKEFMPVF